MSVDFTPSFKPYSGQNKFRFWCQQVLPLVYDDSLSYYELLNKIVAYLNNTIQDVANAEDNIVALRDAFVELQEYVNTTVDNLDDLIIEKFEELLKTDEFKEVFITELAKSIANPYDLNTNYIKGQYVLRNVDGFIYKANKPTSGVFNTDDWDKIMLADEVYKEFIILYNIVNPYNPERTYNAGDYTLRSDGTILKANKQTTGSIVFEDWDVCVLADEITALANSLAGKASIQALNDLSARLNNYLPVTSNGENILDNAYFIGGGSQLKQGKFPINQRGNTSYYSATDQMTIDRWHNIGTIELLSDSIKVYGDMWQNLMPGSLSLATYYTLSVFVGSMNGSAKFGFADTYKDLHEGINYLTLPLNAYSSFYIAKDVTGYVEILAAKLEIGGIQSLATQEGVLIHKTPYYVDELNKCRRYLYRYYAGDTPVPPNIWVGLGMPFNSGNMSILMPCPPMRDKPTVNTNLSNIFVSKGQSSNSRHDISNIEVRSYHSDNIMCELLVTVTTADLTVGDLYCLKIEPVNGYIELNAEI